MFNIFRKRRTFPGIEPETPINDVRYVAIDMELTGLNENTDSIVSIGAVRMSGSRIDLGNTFYQLVSPRTELKADSVVIHEITPSEVAQQPSIDTALGALLDFCGNDVLVGHFVIIDLAFLNREMKRMGSHSLSNPALDTFSMYEWLRRRSKSRDCFANPLVDCRLYEIARCFAVPVGSAHNALMDAYTTAQLFQRFMPLLTAAGIRDISDLLQIGLPFKGGDHFRLTSEFGNF